MQLGREFVQALNQIAEEKGIKAENIVEGIEAALIAAYKKYKGGAEEAEVHVDSESGSVTVSEIRTVVENIENTRR